MLLSTALAATVPTSVPDKILTQAEIRTIIATTAKQYGISQFLALELGRIESEFNPSACNPVSSACGLFQFIDSTWETYCTGDRFDPYDNTKCAMERLSAGELWHWTADKNTKRKLEMAGAI